ncbi:Acyl-CoA synthetase member 2 mitochondrial [Aspergillus nanangensis]|uniref:Acyl-CoA synthetase member 2 mitochondrial n=1 Tax=Aspergillus nanangensis TaxID=2582783 RepID=A0AAD4CLX6_ASPNN|nr:Acyl-CoA synthetase member 2 mitochondrial [Aspergillus nanangensis]
MPPNQPSIVYGPSTPRPVSMTFGELLSDHARHRPNNYAIISHHQNVTLTYRDLDNRSTALARAFAGYGVGAGDKVAIMLGSRTEYIEAFFACAKLGAALVLLNYAFVLEEIVDTLTPVAPKLLITTPGFARFDYQPIIVKIVERLPTLQALVLVDPHRLRIQHTGSKIISYETLFQQNQNAVVNCNVSPHDIVNIQFTSGSTGAPKAAALSHYNIMNCGQYIGAQMGVTDADRVCLPVPLFHSFGLIIGMCASIWTGSTMIFPSELFNSTSTLESIEKYQCTGIYGVTTMFIEEMNNPNFSRTNRSSLKFGIMAGSAMPEDLLQKVTTSFPVPRLYTNWGMTELSSITTMTHHTDPAVKRFHTAGRLFPNFIAKIVEPGTGRVLPWGQKGEIVIAGYGVMRGGYLHNPVQTAGALKEHIEDLEPNGVGPIYGNKCLRTWMHTGDEGYLDEDGYFVITGRIKDIIIRGGENISPVEIEERLFAHPAIVQASVIGVPNARLGEELAAFVELEKGHTMPADNELQDWVRASLSRFKTPRHFWWVGGSQNGVPREWPKTASGKLRKPDLRDIGRNLVKGGTTEQARL